MQFVEETNLKYGLDLKFTKLEAPEVVLQAKTFQVVGGHSKDQQLPKQLVPPQHLEPPQQPHQHTQPQVHQTALTEVVSTALLTDNLPLNKQQMETEWLNSIAAQLSNHSCSTPILLPVTQEYNKWYRHQVSQNINLISALEGYSLWQVLTQMVMNSIQEFDGTDRQATIPWLDHNEAVAIKTGFDPL